MQTIEKPPQIPPLGFSVAAAWSMRDAIRPIIFRPSMLASSIVEYENLRVLQICLQVHELLGVLQFLEQPWVKPLDETVYGSRVEADVERRGASGGCHSDELANEAQLREFR